MSAPQSAKAETISLPYAPHAEKGVLCSLILSPADVGELCSQRLQQEAFTLRPIELSTRA